MNYYMNSLNNSYLAVHRTRCARTLPPSKTLSPGAEIIPVLSATPMDCLFRSPLRRSRRRASAHSRSRMCPGFERARSALKKDALHSRKPLPHAVP